MHRGTIIYIDGPSGAGKSTLAKRLEQHCRSMRKTAVTIHNNETRYNASCAQIDIARYYDVVILDRGWVGGEVYQQDTKTAANVDTYADQVPWADVCRILLAPMQPYGERKTTDIGSTGSTYFVDRNKWMRAVGAREGWAVVFDVESAERVALAAIDGQGQ